MPAVTLEIYTGTKVSARVEKNTILAAYNEVLAWFGVDEFTHMLSYYHVTRLAKTEKKVVFYWSRERVVRLLIH